MLGVPRSPSGDRGLFNNPAPVSNYKTKDAVGDVITNISIDQMILIVLIGLLLISGFSAYALNKIYDGHKKP